MMRLLFASLLMAVIGCKTPQSRSSTEAWAIGGSEEKAKMFVTEVVKAYYGDLATKDVLTKFAAEITDRTTKHNEKQEYVLAAKNREGREALERYIVLEFATSTNLFEARESKTPLRYLGPNGVAQ